MTTSIAPASNGAGSSSAAAVSDGLTYPYPKPTPNASLLLSFRPRQKKMLIVGAKRLAASRVFASLEADVHPVVVGVDFVEGTEGMAEACDEVRWRVGAGQAEWRDGARTQDESWWSSLLDDVDGRDRSLFAVCITDTLYTGLEAADEGGRTSMIGSSSKLSDADAPLTPLARAKMIISLCRARRIPVNVADQPLLCDFSFPATHRFASTFAAKQEKGEASTTTKTSPAGTSLQIAVTTNGKGCRLAGRIRREIVASLPKNVGDAVEKVGEMREMAKRTSGKRQERDEAHTKSLRRKAAHRRTATDGGAENVTEDDLSFDSTPINSPVPQLASSKGDGFFFDQVAHQLKAQQNQEINGERDEEERREEETEAAQREELTRRRMRWVAQMSEYWPIEYLGRLSASEMARALDTYKDERQPLDRATVSSSSQNRDETPRGRHRTRSGNGGENINNGDGDDNSSDNNNNKISGRAHSQHALSLCRPPASSDGGRGHIFLLGSGPGHPGLLTTLARDLLTSVDTDLILSDKLVPSSILSLIPSDTPLVIARKFPGNAEGAQSELIELALRAARDEGKRVVRLKQGDPFVYGRGGEEVLAFAKQDVAYTVVPGISSALAAPLMVGIPVTQRGAADSMTLCTGVGRGGKSVKLPGYERGRTLVVLMGVARLKDVVVTLISGWHGEEQQQQQQGSGTRLGRPFPPYTPIAIIERASSPDQRLVASTLENIQEALTRCGEQRPPGMMVIGWAVMSLEGRQGNVDVLDDEDQCAGDEEALERRDRARVARWLDGQGGYLVKEGLDQGFTDCLRSAPAPETNGHSLHVEQRGPSGWAPPRYGQDGPWGGWGAGE
ncbi:hypothetical protein FA10DRAFT_268797 [Acaromyces ingoldii]|uniref:precorrin-2 dehydrogenase n=1 Tax=Acaromyces ingoldii TaxID=215250 RepID=A0A316YLN7_9BASI|nr:hypothetical protein FA10DRAFT_268797 [Acaromyces ingoldii]PWN88635.1 hypothetical protein FA10DRAFT_268797 [Acaromyces ingoldii]